MTTHIGETPASWTVPLGGEQMIATSATAFTVEPVADAVPQSLLSEESNRIHESTQSTFNQIPIEPSSNTLLNSMEFAGLVPRQEDDDRPELLTWIDSEVAGLMHAKELVRTMLSDLMRDFDAQSSEMLAGKRELMRLPAARKALIDTMRSAVDTHEQNRDYLVDELFVHREQLAAELQAEQEELANLLEQKRRSDNLLEKKANEDHSEEAQRAMYELYEQYGSMQTVLINDLTTRVQNLTHELDTLDTERITTTISIMSVEDGEQFEHKQQYDELGSILSSLQTHDAKNWSEGSQALLAITDAFGQYVNHPNRRKAE